MYNKQQQK